MEKNRANFLAPEQDMNYGAVRLTDAANAL